MVMEFKLSAGANPVRKITKENVEMYLGRKSPWLQPGRHRDGDKHFAVCPYCDNPIQLRSIYNRENNSPAPHGCHTGVPINGFSFDLTDMENCPYKLKGQCGDKSKKRKEGPIAAQLKRLAISEFDRIIFILREDFEIDFSKNFACRMLEQWIHSKGYLYTHAHLRNLPWMIAYFAPSQNIFRQRVGRNINLADCIKSKVPQAVLCDQGFLLESKKHYKLHMQCLHHKMEVRTEDNPLNESMVLRIQDFTENDDPDKASEIYRKNIIFRPDRFEYLINVPREKARRNKELLEMAAKIANNLKLFD